MRRFGFCFPRQVALAAGAVGVILLVVVRPSGGQQPQPEVVTVRSVAPATASSRRSFTRVEVDFTLPAGIELPYPPKVRTVSAAGREVEDLSMYITRRSPTWAGYADLNTESYAAGTYDVTVSVLYRRADGVTRTATSPVRKLAVRVPAAPPAP